MYQLILCFCDPLSWNVFTFCWFCDPLCCFSSPKWECVEPKLRASSRMLILCLSRIDQSVHWKYSNQQFLSIKVESKMTGEAPEVHSNEKETWLNPIRASIASISNNQHLSASYSTIQHQIVKYSVASISIIEHQLSSISINQHLSASISINQDLVTPNSFLLF